MNFKRQSNQITIPERGHLADAGLDLFAPYEIVVEPHSMSHRIDLGVGFEIPPGYCGVVTERSSQGKKGIETLGNIVDSGYTGWVHVTIVNNSDEVYRVGMGEKICQIYFPAILTEPLFEVEEFEETERGDNAHGSTGDKANNGASTNEPSNDFGVEEPVLEATGWLRSSYNRLAAYCRQWLQWRT